METRAYSEQQVTEMRHRFQQGESLNNLEIERLLWTAEWAMGELEHQLQQPVVAKEGGGE